MTGVWSIRTGHLRIGRTLYGLIRPLCYLTNAEGAIVCGVQARKGLTKPVSSLDGRGSLSLCSRAALAMIQRALATVGLLRPLLRGVKLLLTLRNGIRRLRRSSALSGRLLLQSRGLVYVQGLGRSLSGGGMRSQGSLYAREKGGLTGIDISSTFFSHA